MIKETIEVISPEGVEERLVSEQVYQITLTGGGKYRVYNINNRGKQAVIGIAETMDKAEMLLSSFLVVFAMMKIDPDAMIDYLMKNFKGD